MTYGSGADSEASLKVRFLLLRSGRSESSFNGVELTRREIKAGDEDREWECIGGNAFPVFEMLLIEELLNACAKDGRDRETGVATSVRFAIALCWL